MPVKTQQEILEKLKGLVNRATHGRVGPERVSAEANLRDLGVKSIDIVELTLYVEDTFGITIPDEKLDGIKTVGDVMCVVEELCRQS